MISKPLRLSLVALSAGAGVIHMTVIGVHFEESVVAGIFFVIVASFQVGWSGFVLADAGRAAVMTGLVFNLVVIGVWVLSRTTGLPLVAELSSPEPVGLADLVSTGFEVLFVVVAGAALTNPAESNRSPRFLSWATALLVLVLTPLAVFGGLGYPSSFGHHAESGEATTDEHEEPDHDSEQPVSPDTSTTQP